MTGYILAYPLKQLPTLRLEGRGGAAVQQQMWAAKQVDRWCQQRLRETLVSSTVQMDLGGFRGGMDVMEFWKGDR